MATNQREQGEQGSTRGITRSRPGEMTRSGADLLNFSAGDLLANPFAAMRRMHDEMDRVMAEAFGGRAAGGSMQASRGWAPAVEVSEKNNELHVCAELPGLKPEDIKVQVTEDALVIEGERKQQRDETEGGRFHSERSYGRFFRTIPLPEGANADQARADFREGELRIVVPVQSQTNRKRQIPIGTGSTASGTGSGETAGEKTAAKK